MGTLFQSTHLALTRWFLALHLIGRAKTGLSALALKRHLGVSYPTAWPIRHKLMQAMTGRDDRYTLGGEVLVDDAYLGGERVGGKAGRGSENEVPFAAAVSLNAACGASPPHQNDPRPGVYLQCPDRLGQSRLGPR
ncbi:MAG: IS1595 family transposase [Candidatus Competibacter sp.]|nr:IS1595 family transposase [Candidatus Competibacter sp.]